MRAYDFSANRTIAMSPELSRYRIVHFATHGIMNDQESELSGLVLSLVTRWSFKTSRHLLDKTFRRACRFERVRDGFGKGRSRRGSYWHGPRLYVLRHAARSGQSLESGR